MTTMADTANNLAPAQSTPAVLAPSATGHLVCAVALSLLGSAAALALVLVLVNRADWWKGLLAAGIVTTLSAAASVPPIAFGLRRGVYAATACSFVAMGARAVVALGGGILAVKAGGYPAAPTLLLMVVFYFAVLAAESYVLATRMWHMRG